MFLKRKILYIINKNHIKRIKEMFIIPAPLFLRLAYIREKNGLSLRSAADILGISQSHLYDLEEYAKAPDTSLLTKKGRLYDTIIHFLNMYGSYKLFDENVDWVRIKSMEVKDQFFFSLMPFLSWIYVDFAPSPSYMLFFEHFLYRILTTTVSTPTVPTEIKRVICAPTDMTAAVMLNYALSRLWSNSSRRRKIMKWQRYNDISYIPYEQRIKPGKPMGELDVTDLRDAFNFTEVYPDQRPYFTYLVLYILTKKFYVDFESVHNIDGEKWKSWFKNQSNRHIDTNNLDKMPDLPYHAALVLNTKNGDITVCFPTLFGPSFNAYFIVKGDHLGPGNVI
ncbi:MAG: hypothetical protein A4E53_00385 [Pelotomaculum sp. PtaB.Bin104]|nr:MAG: hypothetical protein A4E53_00385 [Pelotomaculum sp. PtaB.Bin104]